MGTGTLEIAALCQKGAGTSSSMAMGSPPQKVSAFFHMGHLVPS